MTKTTALQKVPVVKFLRDRKSPEIDAPIRDLNGYYGPADFLNPAYAAVELDLGCGKGSFTTQLARLHPDRQILAADVLTQRLRKLARRNQREGIANVTVLKAEARMLLGRLLPDRSLARLHVLCPDPWPKGRHRGNRLLSSDFMSQIHRVLADDGAWHFSTDDLPYLEMVRQVVAESKLFGEAPERIADVAEIKTDFELLWNGMGKAVHHYAWKKLPLPPHTIGH